MRAYKDLVSIVIDENRKALEAVDENELQNLIHAIKNANCIQVFGMGRMKCSVRAFVMRLMHMGFDAHVVYDTTCPNIGEGDLLIANAACTTIGYTVMQFAKKAGAKVTAITANPDSKAGRLCDFTVCLPAQVHGGREYEQPSKQPMAAAFEQSIFLLEDIIIQMLMQECEITEAQMAKKHTNIDGYMDFNFDEELNINIE